MILTNLLVFLRVLPVFAIHCQVDTTGNLLSLNMKRAFMMNTKMIMIMTMKKMMVMRTPTLTIMTTKD